MKKKMTTIPFNGTQKQKEELDAVIEELRGEEGALMPIMQRAQDIYGYLPLEVQRY
ncbi:MAG: NAD(P)H-dependent oxidoreductase subunit E, partial [Lachnospiraceae bacterium]